MDMQNGIIDRFREQSEPLLTLLAEILPRARSAGLPVIYVRIAFREGTPEINPRNQSFGALAKSASFIENDSATQVHSAIAPQQGDIVVVKRRVSAFSGSDLELVLRSLAVDSLVLTGIATSGVVLSTLRQAADLDFRITVLRDCCADSDPEVHRVLMDKVFPRQTVVMTASEWIEQLQDSLGTS